MDTFHKNVTKFFEELLNDIGCQPDTKSYIIGIYDKYRNTKTDLSKDSITLLFSEAKLKQDFRLHQNIADWIFFSNTLMPQHLKSATKSYYDTVARISYYTCYRLINRQWRLFEELSDNFVTLEHQVKDKLKNLVI